MRVTWFGSESTTSVVALRAVAARHSVVAVVCSAPPQRWRLRLAGWLAPRSHRPLATLARDAAIPFYETRVKQDVTVGLVAATRPDVIAVAGFHWLLPPAVFQLPALGAINLHPSLLPRHRGPWPLFWIYHSDDHETGVTVHRIDAGMDTGPIVLQERFTLPRGYDVTMLNRRNAERGGELLAAALDSMAAGIARLVQQDEARATQASAVPAGTSMIDFATWDVERVWHYLAGLVSRYREPLVDGRGRAIRYRAVTTWTRAPHGERPGSVGRAPGGWTVFARDGVVRLS